MIRDINLKNYKNPVVEKDDNGSDVYYDKVNGSYRPAKAEEFVRQKFVRFLHKKYNIPYEAMSTEENMSHHISDNHDRMDICIERDTNKGHKIVMVVECKAPEVALTDEVYTQAKKYAEPLDIPVIMVTNGHELDCIKRNSDNTYEDVPELPSYEELADYENIKTTPIEEYSYNRWSYEELHRPDVLQIEKEIDNHISSETDDELNIHALNIAECFLDTTHEVNELPLKIYKFIKDVGIYRKKAGNPIFDFVANYRLVKIKDKNGNIKHIGFTVVNDSVPHIFVGTYYNNTFHNTLELSLKKFMKINENELTFTHNYQVYHVKRDESKDYIKKTDFFDEDSKGNVVLGKVDVDGLLYCDNPQMEELMANLIEYSLLRDECRAVYGDEAKKKQRRK